jgi:hypothetical protein
MWIATFAPKICLAEPGYCFPGLQMTWKNIRLSRQVLTTHIWVTHLELLHVTGVQAALLDGLGVKVKLQDLALLQEVVEAQLQRSKEPAAFVSPTKHIFSLYISEGKRRVPERPPYCLGQL